MGACRSAFSRNIVNENKPLFLSDHARRLHSVMRRTCARVAEERS